MENNVEKHNAWWLGILLLCVIVAGVAIFLSDRRGAAGNGAGASSVSIVKNSGGGETVKNIDAGYTFDIPGSWWAEATGGDSVAVYPADVNVATSSPQCKIELSVFENTGKIALGDWMAAHLGSDPTIVVRQTSLESVNISGAQAVRWTGSMDGVAATLVYAAHGEKIYEIAPSSLDENISLDSCLPDFEKILGLISFR